jgi:shikimate kinase
MGTARPARIALIGFMGSGKSTVGRILARSLGYVFVDLDTAVEQRAGMTVARIFEERGEEAFRLMEQEAVAALAARTRVVVAAGGGAPVREANRRFFSQLCRTFHLEVSFETVAQRTGSGAARPLLASGEAAVRRLYEERLPLYGSLGTGVPTDGRTPVEVAEEIVSLLGSPRTMGPPGESGG